MPAFLHEALVNYTSNMIHITLNNCSREFLHGLNNLQNLISARAICRFIFSFFANQNFSQDRKVKLLCKWISLVLHGLFIKSKCPILRKQDSIVLIITVNSIIAFTKQSSAERYLANIFSQVFWWTFRKFLQYIKKKIFWNFLESSQKNTCGEVFFSKFPGFYRSSNRRCSVKKGFCKIHRKTPVSEALCW